jgi:hypothetical protein
MRLRLKYEPTVENARRFAADIVASAKKVSGIDLDYSVASLEAVDGILENFRRQRVKSDQIAETLFGFGCYVGEVFVRQATAAWRLAVETGTPGVFGFPLVIQTGSASYCNPIAKVFKRVDNGVEGSLPYFFQVFAKPSGAA